MREIQEGARQTATAGMERADLYRECGRRCGSSASRRAPGERRTRGRCPAAVQEGGQGPENPYRHRQAADRLRRPAALLPLPRQTMRDHVLLQAVERVNRPYVDPQGIQKRVGLVVDFVGVLRELKKALKFDSSDVSGVIED